MLYFIGIVCGFSLLTQILVLIVIVRVSKELKPIVANLYDTADVVKDSASQIAGDVNKTAVVVNETNERFRKALGAMA